MVHTITSDPRPSARHSGWFYSYYDKPAPNSTNGSQCAVIFPPSIKDIIRRGFQFDDSSVAYDEALRASVLRLDFHEPQDLGEPSLPPDPEAGWGDPDYLAPAAHPSQPPRPQPQPRQPSRQQLRQQAINSGNQLPPELIKIGTEVADLFCMQYRMIQNSGVDRNRLGDIAQKLTAIAAIPYYRQHGVGLTDDDVKGMTL